MISDNKNKNKTKIIKRFKQAPLYGRTILILSFFALLAKQIILWIIYKETLSGENIIITLNNHLPYLLSDLLIPIIILWIIVINFIIKIKIIRLINNIIAAFIFTLFLIDTFTIYFAQSRLSISDINQFIAPWISNFLWIIGNLVTIVLTIWLIIFIIFNIKKAYKLNYKILLTIIFLTITPLYTISQIQNITNIKTIDNILSINIKALSTEKLEKNKELKITEIKANWEKKILVDEEKYYDDYFMDVIWDWHSPNIILIFAESFSAIDSLRAWWLNDNLSKFDLIQKDWITFKNLISNWVTSDTAHIWSLLWELSITKKDPNKSMYDNYISYTDPLPKFLNKAGYSTTFISTVTLNFLNQRSFLSKIWFENIIWEESFTKNKKYVFDAAPDEILYDKTLLEINKQKSPYFIWLQTVSSHKPYNTPYWKTKQDAIMYSDEKIYKFYDDLKKTWFFNNGLLIIVSDHRNMEPLTENEKDIFGEFWYTKVVWTIVWTGIKKWTINKNIIQHTDIFFSLKKLISKNKTTVSKIYNDVFSNHESRSWWITSSRFFDNKYTITFKDNQQYVFNNISQIKEKFPDIHNYFLSYLIFQLNDKNDNTTIINDKKNINNKLMVIWHQWSPRDVPENSLEGFLLASKNWANWIELDISYTKDKKNVVIHWEKLRATTCWTKYKIKDLTLEELQKQCPLKNGEDILTLKEMLEMIDWLFEYYFVEIKVYDKNDAEKQTLDAINTVKNLKMESKVIFISYDEKAKYILWSQKDIIAWRDTFDINDINKIQNTTHKYFLIPYDKITTEIIKKSKEIWKQIVTYTVNDTWNLQKLLNMGINIIMTDNISLLKEYKIK